MKCGVHRSVLRFVLFLVQTATLTLAAMSVSGQTDNAQIPKTPTTYAGMHIHRADQGTAWPTVGFGSWRLWDAYVAWPNLEPVRGKWDFARLDRYVAMSRVTGVEILLPLGLSPRWASARPTEKSSYSPGNAAEPLDIEDWRNYVRTVATRYQGRIREYEIWNEVNEHGFYSGTPEKMVELTCEAYKVLKSISPQNRLVSPSMVGLGNAPELLGNFLEKGGRNCVDVVGFHFYVPKGPPEALLPLVARVRAAMKKAGVEHLPLWNTEAGWWIENDARKASTPDPQWLKRISIDQAGAWVARSLLLGRSAGLERFYWYSWDNADMGLMDPVSGKYRPGAVAFATVAAWLSNDADADCAPSRSTWVCSVRRRTGNVEGVEEVVIWDTGPNGASYQVPMGRRLLSVDFLYGRSRTAGAVAGLRSIDISEAPLRVTLGK